MRQGDNKPEALLWIELKARRLSGHHFVRQHPIGPYFADFACRKSRLVIEIDGAQHADSAYDRRRDEFFRTQGWSTLRFWNDDVLKHRTSVCETILAALDRRLAENVHAFDLRFVYVGQSAKPGSHPRPLQGERWSAKQTGEGASAGVHDSKPHLSNSSR